MKQCCIRTVRRLWGVMTKKLTEVPDEGRYDHEIEVADHCPKCKEHCLVSVYVDGVLGKREGEG